MSIYIPVHRIGCALRCILRYKHSSIRLKHVSTSSTQAHGHKADKLPQSDGGLQEDNGSIPKLPTTKDGGIKVENLKRPTSLSEMLFKFFRQETQILSNSIEAKMASPTVDTKELPDHIQQHLQAQMDNYNRFLVLLSYHPLAVPPSVLLGYHSTLSRVEPADSSRFLHHLIFHHRWNDIWDIYLRDEITLNDMEDLVEHIHLTLSELRDQLAVWDALESARKTPFSSTKIYAVLVENVQYKFDIDANILRQFLNALDTLDGAQFVFLQVQELEKTLAKVCGDNLEVRAHFFPQLLERSLFQEQATGSAFDLQNIDLCAASCSHVLVANPGVLNIPGFISHAGKRLQMMSQQGIFNYIIHRLSLSMNSNDFYFAMQALTPENAYRMHILLWRSKHHDEFVVNAFIMRLHELRCKNILVETLKKFLSVVNKDTAKAVFAEVAGETEGLVVLRRLFRNRPVIFESALLYALSKDLLSTSAIKQVVEILNTNNSGRRAIRSILSMLSEKKLAPELIEVFTELVSLDLSEYNTTELWRFGITRKLLDLRTTALLFSKLLDLCTTALLFNKILEKTWNPKALERRGVGSSVARLEGDFQEQYRHASKPEKFRLLVRIQAIAQSISITDEQHIVFILEYIHRHLFGDPETVRVDTQTLNEQGRHASDHLNSTSPSELSVRSPNQTASPFFITSKAGKQYIFRQLILQTAHFIYKSNGGSPKGIVKLSNILRRVRFESTDFHASVYEHMVLANPRIALKILGIYKDKRANFKSPLMNKVEQAILKTNAISGRDKLELFYEFQHKKVSLRFTHKLARRTVTLLAKLAFGTLSSKLDLNSIMVVKKMINDTKIPLKVFRKWT